MQVSKVRLPAGIFMAENRSSDFQIVKAVLRWALGREQSTENHRNERKLVYFSHLTSYFAHVLCIKFDIAGVNSVAANCTKFLADRSTAVAPVGVTSSLPRGTKVICITASALSHGK